MMKRLWTLFAMLVLIPSVAQGLRTNEKTPWYYFNAVVATSDTTFTWVDGDSGYVVRVYPSQEDTAGVGVYATWITPRTARRLWFFEADSTDSYDFYARRGSPPDTAIVGMQRIWVNAPTASEGFISSPRAFADEVVPMTALALDAQGQLLLPGPAVGDSATASDVIHVHAIQNTRTGPVQIRNPGDTSYDDLIGRHLIADEKVQIGSGPGLYIQDNTGGDYEMVIPGITRYSPSYDGDSLAIVSAHTYFRGGKTTIGKRSDSTGDSLVVRSRPRFHGRATFEDNVSFNSHINLKDVSGSNVLTLKADSVAASMTYRLPKADGTAAQVLSTHGDGRMYWKTDSEGAGGTVDSTTVAAGALSMTNIKTAGRADGKYLKTTGANTYAWDTPAGSGDVDSSTVAAGALSWTNVKVPGGIVDGTIIGADAVDSSHVAAGALSWAGLKTRGGMIDGTLIAADAIDSTHVAAGALSWAGLKTRGGMIGSTLIAADAVDSTHVAAGALSWTDLNVPGRVIAGAKIAADAIDSSHVAAGALSWTDINVPGKVIAGTKIAADAIDSTHAAAGALSMTNVKTTGRADGKFLQTLGANTYVWESLPLEITKTILKPNLAEGEVAIFRADADIFPAGITIDKVSITLPEDAAYSMVFERWSGDPPTHQADIETVTTLSSEAYKEDASPTNAAISADHYIYLHIPDTEVDWVMVQILYTVN